jgi:DNA-binding FadR family transcriptional regulator
LREAVKVLASKGLIESRPKVGIRVRSRQHWSILDPDLLEWRLRLKPDRVFVLEMTEMRRIFEPAAAALAATRATPEQIAFAKRHLGQMRDGVHDSEVYVSADIAFHGTILAMTQNELLAGFGRTMEAALTLSRRLTVLLPDSALKSLPAHAAVLEAICRRDSATAESKMRELVDGTRADLDAVFSEMRLRQRQAADP